MDRTVQPEVAAVPTDLWDQLARLLLAAQAADLTVARRLANCVFKNVLLAKQLRMVQVAERLMVQAAEQLRTADLLVLEFMLQPQLQFTMHHHTVVAMATAHQQHQQHRPIALSLLVRLLQHLLFASRNLLTLLSHCHKTRLCTLAAT